MKEMMTYLNFDGNTSVAMKFYARCLGAELALMPFSEAKVDVPPEAKDRIIHAKLTKGSCVLMASDILPGMPFQRGNNFNICLDCESLEETEQFFKALWETMTIATRSSKCRGTPRQTSPVLARVPPDGKKGCEQSCQDRLLCETSVASIRKARH